jgi:hypothetical protein
MSTEVGSESALADLLSSAGLNPTVATIAALAPWRGAEEFVDYRLSMLGSLAAKADLPRLRNEAVAAVKPCPRRHSCGSPVWCWVWAAAILDFLL